MSLKYRVRLKTKRVVGPFSKEEITELFLKGHIDGTELCQEFPIGDWKSLEAFSELGPFVKNEKTITKKEIAFSEFKFGKNVKIDINYAELEKKYQAKNPNAPYEDGMEKTVVLRKNPLRATELEKTVIAKDLNLKPEEKEKSMPVKEVVKSPVHPPVEIIATEPEKTHEEIVNEKTEFVNLAFVLPRINTELSASEVELAKQAKIEEIVEKKRLRELQEAIVREQAREEGEEDDDIEVEISEEVSGNQIRPTSKIIVKKKKKGMSVIALLAFLGVFYFFLQGDEKPKTHGPEYLVVKFPITNAVENIPLATQALQEGRKLYAAGTYRQKVMATKYYLKSLQEKFGGNEALGEILLTYAELLDNAKDRHLAAGILYKFVQVSDSKLLTDATIAMGVAHFYGKIKRYQTGIYIIKNYLRAGNKPSPKMLSYYLDLQVGAGEFVDAKKTYEVLKKISQKPVEAYFYLSQFEVENENLPAAKALIEEGLKYYPESVSLLLKYSEILLKEQSLKKFEEILLKIKMLAAEGSPSFLASYFKQMGYLSAMNNKSKEAGEFFKNSLRMEESDDLRDTLSKLEIGGDKVAQGIILESKVLGLLKKAKQQYKNKNIESAFQFAIEAVDADPDNIPAVLFQAELNAERGFFESAIHSLQRITSIYQKNFLLKKKLIEIYIKAYKTEDAERVLSELSQSPYAASAEYASIMGQFSEAQKNTLLALKWYDRALARDPLNDSNMYKMAKILVRNKKFPEAKGRLAKAVLLDPKNVYYHSLYSEILYEQDGTDTAIGYLRDLISEIGEDPILVSAITTIYFKSGLIKEFQTYYKKVQAMPKKDEAFYAFLVAAAKLEGRKEDYVQSSRDLLKLNPGNLRIRMELGEFFYDEKRYDEAILEFNDIKSKLVSYPKVNFQLAKVYLAKNDLAKAKEMALQELELNPTLDSAHFIVGEVYRLEKDYHEAIVKYEKAISINPKSVDALMSMGWIRLNQNYANEAIELFSRALKEEPTNPLIHKQMGDAYRAAGQRAQAKEKYEDYLKLNPVAGDKDLIESLIRSLR